MPSAGIRTHTPKALQLLGAAVLTAVVFAMAGSMAWWNAWAFLAFVAVLGWASARAIGKSPGLAEERRNAPSKASAWDLTVVRLLDLALPLMLVVGALDRRLGLLTRVPDTASVAAFAGMALATRVTYRAIVANPFFSSYVRIQVDRGHVVVAGGPYRVVRHPGYAGAALFNLLTPLALGSWMAAPVGACAALLLTYRTAREDAVLSTDLPGYAEYAAQVPKRLIPWLW
jgi:protein-S-isoprenylcysteine O-methyltransferase Ste14